MSDKILFPSWIEIAFRKNLEKINPRSKDFFEKLLELFPHFSQSFLDIPPRAEIGHLTSHDPKELQGSMGLQSPQQFILLTIFESFHFHAIYQLRELGLSFLAALAEGRFYASAIIGRAMMEVVCINYYSFRRVEDQLKQCIEILMAAGATKSEVERARILTRYYEGTYNMYAQISKANTASSLDWQLHLQEKFGVNIEAGGQSKIVHVLDAIRDIEKKSGLPLSSAYAVFSEFVHPNAGSKMLIVNTKRHHLPSLDALIIGDNADNSEAALFYIDHLSEGIFYTWTLALTLFDRAQSVLSVLDGLVPIEADKRVH